LRSSRREPQFAQVRITSDGEEAMDAVGVIDADISAA
jgi:hypothetical protein